MNYIKSYYQNECYYFDQYQAWETIILITEDIQITHLNTKVKAKGIAGYYKGHSEYNNSRIGNKLEISEAIKYRLLE